MNTPPLQFDAGLVSAEFHSVSTAPDSGRFDSRGKLGSRQDRVMAGEQRGRVPALAAGDAAQRHAEDEAPAQSPDETCELRSWDTAVTSWADAKGLDNSKLFGTPWEAQ